MLSTELVKGVVRLLCLVTLSGGYKIISDENNYSVKLMSCPCGNQGYNITISVNICTNNHQNRSFNWKSCLQENNAQESCKKFKYCQKCVTGYDKCVSCPKGDEGEICRKENSSPIGYIKKRRKTRDHTCEMPPSPSPGRITCTIDEEKMVCTGTCRDGFRFPDGTSERIHECNNLNGRWSPEEYFPECQPVDNCAIQLVQPASSFDCNHTHEFSICRIKCSYSTGYFRCSLQGVWSPSLPSCVISSPGATALNPTRQEPRCRCQNGGVCQSGICLCPPDYEGASCETRKNTEARCQCQNGGVCQSGICLCPPDYEGASCEMRQRQNCPDLGHLHDGQQVNRGSSIIYSCNRPYQLSGASTITCRADGSWSAPKPRCVAPAPVSRECPDLGSLENGRQTVRGDTITYSCDSPYELSGDYTISCNRDAGTWNAPKPFCIAQSPRRPSARECPDLGSLENGQQIVRGDTITYSCDSSYELSGDYTISCNRDAGTWNAPKPFCIAQSPRRPSGNCGVSDSPRTPYITNGNASSIGQWPWHSAISRYQDASQAWEIICGASLVSQQYVITAAHCVTRGGSSTPIDNSYLTIYLGKYYYSFERDDDYVQIKSVRHIVIHPKYNPTRYDADIALVRLQTLAEYSPRVHPVCLPTASSTRRNLLEGATGIVTGWGFDERGKTPDVLQQARIPVVSEERCEDGYRQAALDLTVTENMYCAGYEQGRIDICSGDSGGPMVFSDQSSRTWILEGIVSWGSVAGCGRSRQYGGYTRVQRFVNWIREYL